MALIECTECKEQISDKADTCPKCGAPQKRKGGSSIKYWVGVPVALIAAFLAFGAAFGDEEKAKARGVIDLCWKDQKRPSVDPATARFIASTCERLEDEFKKKYGHRP